MPIRVRCRCGQELVLRYGEWVHIVIGLVLLSLIVHLVVLVLLYLRIEEVGRRAGLPAPSLEPPPAAPDPSGEPAAPVPASSSSVPPRPLRPLRTLEPADDVLRPIAPPPVAQSDPRDGTAGTQGPGPTAPGPSAPAPSTPGPSALDPSVSGPSVVEPAVVEPAVVGPPARTAEIWAGEPLLVRFVILQTAGASGIPPEAFLADPDPRLRRAASARARAAPSAPPPSVPSSASPLSIPDDSLLRDIRDRAAPLLGDPAVQTLREALRAAPDGIDVALVVDVSRSMEEPLEALRSAAVWLVPCLSWAVPGSRWGLVLYRDDVETVVPLGADRGNEVILRLQEARAEGGGDVPEGVHRALRAALSLGRLPLRENVPRHLILVGDAPPPHAERRGLFLLAAQAFAQGGYRTHAVSFRGDPEFPEMVPFFPELARRGGGRSVVLDAAGPVGEEIFLCLFPAEARPPLELVRKALRELFVAS